MDMGNKPYISSEQLESDLSSCNQTGLEIMWRWDQGRLGYFSLDKIRKIASVIVEIDGVDLTANQDPMREVLERVVGLPFAPPNYRVWRNYARVFKVLGLASNINNHLVATETCKGLIKTGDGFLSYDDYIHYLGRVFYYPSPIFENYDISSQQKFPFCAILKLLISKIYKSGDSYIDIDDVFNLLIANEVTGMEEISYYSTLKEKRYTPSKQEPRQVREILIFISQLSYLSWIDKKLFIDAAFINSLTNKELDNLVSPIINIREENQELEVQKMFGSIGCIDYESIIRDPSGVDDIIFTEGKKIRVSHLRTERNRKVVNYYFEKTKNEALCDVCDTEVKNRYPWVNNLIEVHHILPLSSPLQIDRAGTSMSDLVGLCPNCHRATHAFYRNYFAENNVNDFESNDHAKEVYGMVKSSFVSL